MAHEGYKPSNDWKWYPYQTKRELAILYIHGSLWLYIFYNLQRILSVKYAKIQLLSRLKSP